MLLLTDVVTGLDVVTVVATAGMMVVVKAAGMVVVVAAGMVAH